MLPTWACAHTSRSMSWRDPLRHASLQTSWTCRAHRAVECGAATAVMLPTASVAWVKQCSRDNVANKCTSKDAPSSSLQACLQRSMRDGPSYGSPCHSCARRGTADPTAGCKNTAPPSSPLQKHSPIKPTIFAPSRWGFDLLMMRLLNTPSMDSSYIRFQSLRFLPDSRCSLSRYLHHRIHDYLLAGPELFAGRNSIVRQR